nr:hypothetical protein [Tanacetum cinerariifolium]
MAPRRTTRSIAYQETVNATTVTNAQLQAMIDQGVTAALAARDALRSTNGDDSHNSGTVKFATCTLHSVALTWWNTHVQTVGHEAAYGMTWKTLMKMMTDKYCPRNEIRKLEMELWDLKVKESDKIEKYVGGLPDMIHGSVVASKPKTMQKAIEIATELMDKKIRTFAERETASKRKFENTSRNTQNQQQHSNKRQNTGRVYTAASGEKKQYVGSRPLCAKCNYHHDGPCAPKCRNCNKIGHLTRDCRNTANTNNANNQRGTGRQTVILELQRIYYRRSTKILELRTTLQGQVTALQRQRQVTALKAQVTTLQGQQGLVGDHTQSELPEEAGGSA